MGCTKNLYDDLIKKDLIIYDEKQLEIIALYDDFLKNCHSQNIAFFSRIFKKKSQNPLHKGFYIYGSVGRGKTMLMDLFFSCIPLKKKRVHFHEFMRDIQHRIEKHRQEYLNKTTKNPDPIPAIAKDLRQEAEIICFDEFTVTDIADAMILGRLFSQLFSLGLIFVATSNVAPKDLYANGLNRQLFLPFIKILENHVKVFNLDAPIDYRLKKTKEKGHYFYPIDNHTNKLMDDLWEKKLQGHHAKPNEILVHGRKISIPLAHKNMARFSFSDLFLHPLGAHDFLKIGQAYHLFFLDNVPIFTNEMRNSVKRFIIFIDILYEQNALLYMQSANPIDSLYTEQSQSVEHFEFQRTISRLKEMQSKEYLQEYYKRHR